MLDESRKCWYQDIKQYSTGRDKIARKDQIKVYNEKEDIVADYENFRKDWEYDRDKMGGVHKSGLKIYQHMRIRTKSE